MIMALAAFVFDVAKASKAESLSDLLPESNGN